MTRISTLLIDVFRSVISCLAGCRVGVWLLVVSSTSPIWLFSFVGEVFWPNFLNFHIDDKLYILIRRKTIRRGGLAQLAERLLCMQKVRGSIPLTSNSPFSLSFSFWSSALSRVRFIKFGFDSDIIINYHNS